MLTIQTPPPAPPPFPDPVFIQGGGPPEAVVVAGAMIVLFIVVGVLVFPLIKAFARRLEGGGAAGTDPALLERVAELEHRLAEAEERIDFNERMLAQREPLGLPREKAD